MHTYIRMYICMYVWGGRTRHAGTRCACVKCVYMYIYMYVSIHIYIYTYI